jgi:hypothetical protein
VQKKFPKIIIRRSKKIAGKSKENDFDIIAIEIARSPSILKYILSGSFSGIGKTVVL